MYLGLLTYRNLRDRIRSRSLIHLGAVLLCLCLYLSAQASDGKKTLVISSIAPIRHGARLTDVDTVSRGDTVNFRVSVRYTNYAKATKTYKLNKKDSVYVTVSLNTKDMLPDEQTSSVMIKKQKGTDVVGHVLFTYPLKNPYFFTSDGLKLVITVNDEVLFSKVYRYVFNKGDTAPPAPVVIAPPVRLKGNGKPVETPREPVQAINMADVRTAQNMPEPTTSKTQKEEKAAKPQEKHNSPAEAAVKEPVKAKEPKPVAEKEKEKPAAVKEKPVEKKEEKPVQAKEPEKVPQEKTTEKPIAAKTETPKEKPAANNITKAQKNFYFTVQLVAGKLPQAKIDELAKVFGPIGQEEVKPGIIRYMVGQYTSYAEANKGLTKAKQNGYPTAFVTGYENDTRLTPNRMMELTAKNP